MSASFSVRAGTAFSLGVRSIARVLSYRGRLRAGIHPVQRIAPTTLPQGAFFERFTGAPTEMTVPLQLRYFGWQHRNDEELPDWHRNVLGDARAAGADLPWWRIPDFDPTIGDIKGIWEPSRFDWVLRFAQQARGGEAAAVHRLNRWLSDWCRHNPAYRGPNWKCGQEASIRVMHLAVAALVLEQTASPRVELIDLLTAHLRRIAPTIAYAVGQDNNHGTSEAAALFIGGSWLAGHAVSDAPRWERLGRRWLSERAQRLIGAEGSFSQYSVNYHRLMLDTFSLAELWRRQLALAPFDAAVRERLAAATHWLRTMTDETTGDAPNIGANDGANLLPLTHADYRDYRPAVQLASALFVGRRAYADGGCHEVQLRWLRIEAPPMPAQPRRSATFDDGGYAVLTRRGATAVLRYPRFRFRPSHADALHVDLWVDGQNLLRDGGSFSYAAGDDWQRYFTGAPGHSTAEIDDQDQMPRLGRFLWGAWLMPEDVRRSEDGSDVSRAAAGYTDRRGASHRRELELRDTSLTMRDTLGGFARRAVVRWRLRPGAWTLRDGAVSDGAHRLQFASDAPVVRCELVEGWESRYYGRRTPLPVVEVELGRPGVVVSTYTWGS